MNEVVMCYNNDCTNTIYGGMCYYGLSKMIWFYGCSHGFEGFANPCGC